MSKLKIELSKHQLEGLTKKDRQFLLKLKKVIDGKKLDKKEDIAIILAELVYRCHYNMFVNNRLYTELFKIEQTAGQVLDYPWYYKDQKNFPGTTEEDGVCTGEHTPGTIVSELANKYKKLLEEKTKDAVS